MGHGAYLLAVHVQNGGLLKCTGEKRHQTRALWELLIFPKTFLAPHLMTLASK